MKIHSHPYLTVAQVFAASALLAIAQIPASTLMKPATPEKAADADGFACLV